MTAVNRSWRFAAYPQGMYKPTDFRWMEEPVPDLADGQFRVRNLVLSLDPTNRAWGEARDTYMPQIRIGEVMRGLGIGIVEASRHPRFAAGTYVTGLIGWQDYLTTTGLGDDGAPSVAPLPRDARIPLEAYLGLFGFIGLTAYFGLLRVGRPLPGDTLVVSAAAGATGSLVGQIGAIMGCRVIGIAGGADKCAWLRDSLGFDAAIDYKRENVGERLAVLAPDGIDVLYENVGGATFEQSLEHLALGARVVVAGMISTYNDPSQSGPRNLVNLIMKRASMAGFVVLDYLGEAEKVQRAIRDLAAWHQAGRLQYRTHVVDGLEQAPVAVNLLFTGGNQGKLMVRIAPDPA